MDDHTPDDPGHLGDLPGDDWTPAHHDAPEPDAPGEPGPFELGGEHHSAPDDAPGSEPTPHIEHVIELPVEHADASPLVDHLGIAWPDASEGCCGVSAVVAVAQSLLGVEPDQVTEVLHRLGMSDADLAFGVDGHATALALGELGLDATALHGDIDDLAGRVEAGQEVLVSAGDGPPLVIERVDLGTGTVELVGADGTRQEVPLTEFEDCWEAASYGMVLADGPEATGSAIALSTGPVAVLAMTWERPEL